MLSPDHGSSEVRHGFGCTGSLCVDSTNQIDGSIKPRGVRPKTVVSMTERNPSNIRKRLPQFFFPPKRKTGLQICVAARSAENRTPKICFRAPREKKGLKYFFQRSARKTGLQICVAARSAENSTPNICFHTRYTQNPQPYTLNPA